MTQEEERLLAALAKMASQYLETDGVLDHMWMSAGEDAFSVLSDYGLIETDDGRGATWTDAGKAFLASN